MSKRIIRASAALSALTVLAGPMAGPASAHERRTVGSYLLVVGWADEPAYTGFKNAVQVRVSSTATNEPVVDLAEGELKARVSYGSEQSEEMPVEPRFRVGAFGEPGDYQADLIPSRPGNYSFQFTGTIKGEKIDEKFTCGEQTFDCPRAPAQVEFPAKDPSAAELGARVQRMDARLASASTTAGLARGLGVAGIVVGAVAVALVAIMRKKPAA